jgi:F0F1-type ATP synthase epsilon subunit
LVSGDRLGVLAEHAAIVNCVKFNGVRVVSGDEDGCVKIWDPVNYT